METWKVTIPGLLPGLNEYIDAERAVKGKYKAAAMKKQAENVIGFMVKTQLRGVRFDRPVIIHYRWIEPNRRPGERRLEPDRGLHGRLRRGPEEPTRGSDYRDIRRRKTTWQILRL